MRLGNFKAAERKSPLWNQRMFILPWTNLVRCILI